MRGFIGRFLAAAAGAALVAGAGASRRSEVSVEDAFARPSARGYVWTIGTRAVTMTLDGRDGRFRVTSLRNLLVRPPVEYVPADGGVSPIAASIAVFGERHTVSPLWQWFLAAGQTHDLTADGLRIQVKAGESLGFAVGAHGDYTGDQIAWPITVDYGDGTIFRSADELKVEPGPVWSYQVHVPGTGLLVPMDAVERSENTNQAIRIPSQASAYRVPGIAPHIGPSVMHPTNETDAVRVWRAPKTGTVTIRGIASHVGGGDVDLKILRITGKGSQPAVGGASGGWIFGGGQARQAVIGGRPVVQLDLVLRCAGLRVTHHVAAFPRTSVLRQWSEVENPDPVTAQLRPFANAYALQMAGPAPGDMRVHWMVGGNSQRDQGAMRSEAIDAVYHRELGGSATLNYVPWLGMQRQSGERDGWFAQLDYRGGWRLSVDRENGRPMLVRARLPELMSRSLAAGQRVDLPIVTTGVFRGDLDDMSRRVYDWQYEYLWDFTHDDWFGLMQFTTAWWAGSSNLQEQFAGRLAHLDIDWTDYMRECGLDVLWDDAGWAAHPDIWLGNREGPDFAETVRYVAKTGMKWALWFPGDPGIGIMSGKVGAWGDFQWRTDGLGFNHDFDRSFRQEVSTFLLRHPGSSWQTCSGGSTYSHTFEMQRFGDVHYDTDMPGSEITNNNFSYLEVPDKSFDNLAAWQPSRGLGYIPDISRRMLTGAPKWGLYIEPADMEPLRRITDLYRYLTQVGVAGRWTYVAHPAVTGDDPDQYLQRVNRGGTRSLLIIKRRPAGTVTVCPRGLDPEARFVVDFDSGRKGMVATGAELMARGIVLRDCPPGELVYFNLSARPGSGRDHDAPTAPGRVLTRRETNLGHTGVAVYWSPGSDGNWVSSYEVRRGDRILGRAATGLYYFDRTEGWDPAASYAVRTVDGDGNRSPWTAARPIADDPLVYSAMGGHSAQAGRGGWSAEASTDGVRYRPMTWTPPARRPSADLGGTPNQRGGAEGYWEAPEGARIGRGWQLASPTAVCARVWTAPRSGAVRITGRAMKEYYHRADGGPLQVRVTINGAQAWPAVGWEALRPGDLTGSQHDLAVTLAAGDVVRFELDRASGGEHDLLAWMPRIEYADTRIPASASVVRILCGARGSYVDSAGNTWSEDRCFSGGNRVTRHDAIEGTLPGPGDQTLYGLGRIGEDFSYEIPVEPGLYAVRLKFAEPHLPWYFQRPFTVRLNGKVVYRNIDICQAARGVARAHDRVLRYVTPDASGRVCLRFTGGDEPSQMVRTALVRAIEVLPEHGTRQRVVFSPGKDLVDWAGVVWPAPRTRDGSVAVLSTHPVTQASPTLYDQDLYRSARTGERVSWTFHAVPGLYTVHLKFAEMWLAQPGQRPMNIWINGKRFWRNWDPMTAAGRPDMAIDLRAGGITPDHDGRIVVTVLATGKNPAILQALEIE